MLDHLKELKSDFEGLEAKDRYELLIELGKELPEFPKSLMTDENRVPGCVSGVFIDVSSKHGKMIIKGISHSLIVKGYVKILLDALNGLSPKEIIAAKDLINTFIQDTGISESLVATRANAFGNIYAMIRKKASAFI